MKENTFDKMGTTARKILAHAPCSILAVKPGNFIAFWK
ncbi:MAG: hypothetical protein ACI9R3_002965 [Verrucomicrobiales bacterium]|jgi:hypothetical protein